MAIKIINPVVSEAVGGGGASFNIHYGLNPPEDTSMLWVETEKQPNRAEIVGADYNAFTKQTSILPSPMMGIGAAAVGTKVYLFGGYAGAGRDTIMVFDSESKTVETLSTTLNGNPVYHIAAEAVGTKIYLFGGYSGTGPYESIRVFDTETNKCEILTNAVLPNAAYLIASGVVGTKIYLFGGCGGSSTYFDTVSVFDTETNTIETLSVRMDRAMCGQVAGVVGTKIYLFGGYYGYYSVSSHIFDTETNTFETNPKQLYLSGYGAPSAIIDNVIYAFGGVSSGTVTNAVSVYDVDNPVSVAKFTNNMSSITAYAACAQIGNVVYIFGGQSASSHTSSSSSSRYSTIYSFDPRFRLTENTSRLYVSLTNATNRFSLMKGENNIECRIYKDYIGNADGKPELQRIYLYKNNSWAIIN
jgi:N-acetylneuraminic acid mutarotase